MDTGKLDAKRIGILCYTPYPAAAQPAHAADRFAREIIGILTVYAVRLRRLMGRPLDGTPSNPFHALAILRQS